MRKILILSALSLVTSCLFNKNKSEEPGSSTEHHDFMLHMDTQKASHIKNFNMERFKKYLKEGHHEGAKAEIGSWEFVKSIHHFLHYFIQEGAQFECTEEAPALFCKVNGKDGRFLMDFSIVDRKHSAFQDFMKDQTWEYAMHICRVQVGLAITQDNKDFWEHVHAFEVKEKGKTGTKKMEKSKGKSIIYKEIDFTHYQGAIIAVSGAGEHTKINDYRALVSIVKEGSDMWMKFVDQNCIRNGVIVNKAEK